MSINKTKQQIEATRKQCEVEAKVVNSSFDKLFKDVGTQNDRQSHSQLLDKESTKDANSGVNKNSLHMFHQMFYASIMAKAKVLLQKKDQEEYRESSSLNPDIRPRAQYNVKSELEITNLTTAGQ